MSTTASSSSTTPWNSHKHKHQKGVRTISVDVSPAVIVIQNGHSRQHTDEEETNGETNVDWFTGLMMFTNDQLEKTLNIDLDGDGQVSLLRARAPFLFNDGADGSFYSHL